MRNSREIVPLTRTFARNAAKGITKVNAYDEALLRGQDIFGSSIILRPWGPRHLHVHKFRATKTCDGIVLKVIVSIWRLFNRELTKGSEPVRKAVVSAAMVPNLATRFYWL